MKIKNYDGINRIFQNDEMQDAYVKSKYIFFRKDNITFELDKVADGVEALDILEIDVYGNLQIIFKHNQEEVNFLISAKCNSNCIMCPVPETFRRKESLSQEKIMTLIQLLPESVKFVNITGGEPTLEYQHLINILEKFKKNKNNLNYQFLTNGRSFCNREFIENIKQYLPDKLKFGIPIHGSDQLLHDSITQARGSFAQTVSGIYNLINLNCIIEIRIVVSALNYTDLENIARFIIGNFIGIKSVIFMGLELTGNAAINKKIIWKDYKEIFPYVKNAVNLLVEAGLDVDLYNFPLCSLERGYWSIEADSITSYKVYYPKECTNCVVKSMCGGVFKSSYLIGKPFLEPLECENEKLF